jgi:predicted acyl esterase
MPAWDRLTRLLPAALLTGSVLLSAVAAAETPGEATPVPGPELREAWIPMGDGVRLAADLYLPPARAEGERLPVLLEYLPYRKTESRARNHRLYSYFVHHGYAVARVDIRGTGNSEGRLIPHEYSAIEQRDGETVIAWLAEQPWSNGRVGMFGISWGGFNAIQMALRGPPALKAIIAVDATEDLYQEDVHYMDGVLHVDSWEMSQDLDNARPGAPDYVIDQSYFDNRFDTEPWMLTYKRQQRDGPFWDRASARDRHQLIRIPTFHIGGWYDGYRDSLPRMLERAAGPVKALIGPCAGLASSGTVSGTGPRTMALGTGLAAGAGPGAAPVSPVRSPAGRCPAPGGRAPPALRGLGRRRSGRAGDVVGRRGARPATDRRLQPGLRFRAAGAGHWIARLSDVAPDGTVTLVTGAARNGSHRDSAREPAAIQPGQWFPLDIEMHFTSWVFPKGHRIRLAVNNAQWPMLWPSPYPMTTRLQLGGNRRPIRNCPAMRTSASAALPATARFRR